MLEIGKEAFRQTALKTIICENLSNLHENEFSQQSCEISKVKMRNLRFLSTATFQECVIDKFDAPNLTQIHVADYYEECLSKQNTFEVGKKNFIDFPGIIKKVEFSTEPDYLQLVQKLPQKCFECDCVNKENFVDFIIENAAVFPENIKNIKSQVYSDLI